MIKDEVLSWLRAGQPYEEGVDLYAKHCNNATLLKNFQRKDTESRKEKLAYKLVMKAGLPEKFIHAKPSDLPGYKATSKQSAPPKKETTPAQPQKQSKNKSDGKPMFRDLPKEVQLMIVERGEIQKERAAIHAQINDVPKQDTRANNAKRKALGEKVDQLTGRINELKAKIDAYEKKLTLPAEKAPEKDQTSAHDPGPKKEAKIKKLSEINTEIEELNKKLGK